MSTKKFIAGGDSFTFGSELSDCDNFNPSNLTWAALLAKKLNLNYQCVAKQGAGNGAIMRNVIKALENNSDVAFVGVMWSWPSRVEINVNQPTANLLKTVLPETDIEDNWLNISPWNSLTFDQRMEMMPDLKNDEFWLEKYRKQITVEKNLRLDTLSEIYFSITSEDFYLYQSAIAIFSLQCYLEKKGIDYVFAATTNHILEIFNEKNIPFVSLIDKTKWLNLDIGMYQWALENKYEISPLNHPVDKAHVDWLDVYYKD